jgi:heme exporter protein D
MGQGNRSMSIFQSSFKFDFQFGSVADFVTMGGHGVFVWSAYGITVFALIGLAIRPMLRKRKFLAALHKQIPKEHLQSSEDQRSSHRVPR